MDALTRLGSLFAHPDEGYAARARAAAVAHPPLASFASHANALGTAALQERFVTTFDLNPAAALEVGWHLFGEQYERGAFLVMLRDRLRAAHISEAGELPDHLQHVLSLVATMRDDERGAFVARYLAPALEKIGAAVPEDNPFSDLVRVTREVMEAAGQAARTSERHDD